METLASQTELRVFKPGESLTFEGQAIRYLYFVEMVEPGAGLKFSASSGTNDRDGGGSVHSNANHSHSQRGQAGPWGEAEGRAERERSGERGGNGSGEVEVEVEGEGEVEIDHVVNDNDGSMDFRGLILGLGERLSGVFRYQGMAKVTATTNQPEPTSSSTSSRAHRLGGHSYEPHPFSPLGKLAARNGSANGFSPATTPSTVGVGGDVAKHGPSHQLPHASQSHPQRIGTSTSTDTGTGTGTGSYTVLGQELEYTIKPEQYYPRPMEFTGEYC